MASYRELVNAFRELGLNQNQPVIVHASFSSIGEVRGGPETLLGALTTISKSVIAPTFTYKTMIIPETGPEDNASDYGSGKDANRMAEFFTPDMPADPLMGILPEMIRKHPGAKRSVHPILSFAGINADGALCAQTLEDPLAPIAALKAEDAIVLLIGVDHTVNTSIHYAEQQAGRRQFTRWALTPQGVKTCPGFPGCSEGFGQVEVYLAPFSRTLRLGNADLTAIPLPQMVDTLATLLRKEPLALLCNQMDCLRCAAVRRDVERSRAQTA